jgi:cytochrome b561
LSSRFPGQDHSGGYGWISIALHWLTAAAILVLLFAGDSIGELGAEARNTHTTIATCAWIVLAARIGWRLQQGHPPRPPRQGRFSFTLGISVHYLLLAALAVLLVSGPLAGWASGLGIAIFGLQVPGAEAPAYELHAAARWLHAVGAGTMAAGVVLHVAGVLKHMFVDRDRTLDRILAPPERPQPQSAANKA